jgi:capsular polysaccharide biosynthesis protein/Mrp family chromosome partitioning ATPase
VSSRAAPAESELRRYADLVRRHLRLLILLPIVALVLAVVATKVVMKPTWTATAQVLVAPSPVENVLLSLPTTPDTDRNRTVATEGQILQSESVARSVAAQFPEYHGDPKAVPAASAGAIGATDIMGIQVSAGSRHKAASLATAYAKAYLDFRRGKVLAEVQTAEASLSQEVDNLQTQITAYDDQIATSIPENRQFVQDTVGPLRDALVTQQGTLRDRLTALQVESRLETGGSQLVEPAPDPSSPSSPRTLLDAIIALIAAALIALAVVAVQETLDDRVHSYADVAAAAGDVTILGVTPRVTSWRRRRRRRAPAIIARDAPDSVAAEVYRSLRAAVEGLHARHVRTMLMVGPRGNEDVAIAAANVAVALARGGTSVLLVDADLRHPTIEALFGVAAGSEGPGGSGIGAVLSGGTDLRSVIQTVAAVPGLSLLPAGPAVDDPSGLFTRDRTRDVLSSLRDHAEFVVVLGPPLLTSDEASALVGSAQSVAVTARRDVTHRGDLIAALDVLDSLGATFPAVIFHEGTTTPVPPKARRPGQTAAQAAKAADETPVEDVRARNRPVSAPEPRSAASPAAMHDVAGTLPPAIST